MLDTLVRGSTHRFRELLRARTARAAVAGATVARRPADVSKSRTSNGKPSAACGVRGQACTAAATRAVIFLEDMMVDQIGPGLRHH